jgi:hypothetical protein
MCFCVHVPDHAPDLGVLCLIMIQTVYVCSQFLCTKVSVFMFWTCYLQCSIQFIHVLYGKYFTWTVFTSYFIQEN